MKYSTQTGTKESDSSEKSLPFNNVAHIKSYYKSIQDTHYLIFDNIVPLCLQLALILEMKKETCVDIEQLLFQALFLIGSLKTNFVSTLFKIYQFS